MKRLFFSFIAVLVFIFLFEWLLHGLLLKRLYSETAALWRPQVEMQQHAQWLMFGQVILAALFTYIFTKGYEGKGAGEGLRYGLWIGLLMSSHSFVQYAVSPLSGKLICAWVGGGIIEFVLAGILLSMIYKPTETQ